MYTDLLLGKGLEQTRKYQGDHGVQISGGDAIFLVNSLKNEAQDSKTKVSFLEIFSVDNIGLVRVISKSLTQRSRR